MFRRQKELDRLAIPGRRVLRLQQSFNRIQVALPGFGSQEATAFLCAFGSGRGVRVAAVLHLHASGRLAIYLNDDGEVADRKAAAVFNEGIGFVESMGFLLDDLHVQKMSSEERDELWKSLPLAGIGKAPERGGGTVGAPAGAPSSPSRYVSQEESGDDEWLPPSLRRRLRPSPEKVEERRVKLCEGLGRVLASM